MNTWYILGSSLALIKGAVGFKYIVMTLIRFFLQKRKLLLKKVKNYKRILNSQKRIHFLI